MSYTRQPDSSPHVVRGAHHIFFDGAIGEEVVEESGKVRWFLNNGVQRGERLKRCLLITSKRRGTRVNQKHQLE